jgi:glycosyltransferase involved in cell wall biosynthesis
MRELRRVCLLTPGHLSTNPRLVKEADALTNAGYAVSVIAADFALWARDADRLFSDQLWKVVHTLSFGPHSPRRARFVQLLRLHVARAIVAAGVRPAPIVLAAWHPIGPDLVRAAVDVPADLYIAHYPAALPAAAIAAQRHQARYAFDAEDFHLGDTPDGPEYNAQRRMVRIIEGRYLPACAYVTAASPGIAEAYARAYDIARRTVVLNVFPRAQAPCCPTPRGTATPGPSVYWFSQTIGSDRGLECAVRAIGRAQSRPHLYLRGIPAPRFLDSLRKIASDADALDRLHVLPPAVPAEMERLAAAYDVGFSGETGYSANNQIALGNKLFSYLLAGIPLVMSNIPAHQDVAPAMGDAARLYAAENPADLAAALDTLLGNPGLLASARAAAWRLGQERFNWDLEQAKLLSCVEAALGSGECGGDAKRAGLFARPRGKAPKGG